jgi:hypothetical protein
MKKILLSALLFTAATLTAMADWQPSDKDIKTIAVPDEENSSFDFTSPMNIQTDDGKTICVWRKHTKKDPVTGEELEKSRFLLYYQVYDADGNPTLPGDGVCVSNQPTNSAAYGQLSAALAPNGDILMTFTDQREYDEKTQAYIDKVYLYRYTQTGESVWSTDGIQLPDLRKDVVTKKKRLYKVPTVCVSGDYIYFSCNYEENDGLMGYYYYYEIACLDQDGNILQSDIQPNLTLFNKMTPAPEGSVYLLIPNHIDYVTYQCYGVDAMRLGPDCQNMWANKVTVEPENMALTETTEQGTFAMINDFKTQTYTDGSMLMLYYVADPPSKPRQLHYNRVLPDGTVLEKSVVTGDSLQLNNNYDWIIEDGTVTVFDTRVYEYDKLYTDNCHLWMNRLSVDGTPLWEDEIGRSIMMKEDHIYDIIGTSTKDGIYYVLYYAILPDAKAKTEPHSQCYVEAYDANGNLLWNRPVLDGAAPYRVNVCYKDYMMKPIYVQGDDDNQKGLMMAFIDPTDDTQAVIPEGLLPGEFSINGSGGKVSFAKANLEYRTATGVYRFAGAQNRVLNYVNTFVQYPKNNYEFIDLLRWSEDFGTHPIQNLGNKTDDWRLLNFLEWKYLLEIRPNAAQKKGLASVEVDDGLAARYPENGIVLLPDEFTWPLGVTWNPNAENYNENYFNKKVWAMMEANGAVFLTAAGQLEGATLWGILENNRNTLGSYWINEKFQDEKGNWFIYQVNFGADAGIQTPSKASALPPSYGASVRLVKDTTPSGVNNVTGDKADDCQKTVKRLINGNIVIESNGILYNTVGQKISK